MATLQEQQKELAARQAVYNQQQLDFITRKNALAAQQFDFADKLASYNTQAKLFNENLEKMENERTALHNEQQLFEERVRALDAEKADFEAKKAQFEKDKEASEKNRLEAQQKALDEQTELQRKYSELQEREMDLNQRENALNRAERNFRSQQYAASYTQPEYAYAYATPYSNGYGATAQQPAPQAQTETDYTDLRQRAQTDGIKLQTAGSFGVSPMIRNEHRPQNAAAINRGYYNIGATLFKSAFIIFCIVAFESLIVYFMRDFLHVSPVYPIVGFAVGFVLFVICAILNACGYRPHAKRKKHPSYILTMSVIFVITVIIVTMIAVYFKAQMGDPAQLLSFVIIPVVYLLNILFFGVFFHLFSLKESKNNLN